MPHRPPLSRLLAALGLLASPILVILAGLVAFAGLLPRRNLTVILRQPELLDAVDRALDRAESETVEITMPVPVERSFDAHILPLSPRPRGNPQESPTVLLALQDMTKVMRADRL